MVGENTEAVGAGVGGGTTGNKMPTLEEYGTNLTKLAEEVGLKLFFYRYIMLCVGMCIMFRQSALELTGTKLN